MCVCHVCAGLTHARHTHIRRHRHSAQPLLVLMHAACVCVMYGYHIRVGHNSDSKST